MRKINLKWIGVVLSFVVLLTPAVLHAGIVDILSDGGKCTNCRTIQGENIIKQMIQPGTQACRDACTKSDCTVAYHLYTNDRCQGDCVIGPIPTPRTYCSKNDPEANLPGRTLVYPTIQKCLQDLCGEKPSQNESPRMVYLAYTKFFSPSCSDQAGNKCGSQGGGSRPTVNRSASR